MTVSARHIRETRNPGCSPQKEPKLRVAWPPEVDADERTAICDEMWHRYKARAEAVLSRSATAGLPSRLLEPGCENVSSALPEVIEGALVGTV